MLKLSQRLHQLYAVDLGRESFVDLDERNDSLAFPQVSRRSHAGHVAVHRLLEQNRAEDVIAVKGGGADDPAAELVHQVEHLLLSGVRRLRHAVRRQSLSRATAALVESGEKPAA